MPEEEQERGGIVAAVDSTDWARYAGPASDVRRRGERRRRRIQACAAFGTTVAVVGAVVAVNGFDKGSVTRQGAAQTTSGAFSSAPVSPQKTGESSAGTPKSSSSSSSSSTSSSGTGAASGDYPSFPAELPTKPVLVADPGKVLKSGVIGAGSVGSHHWQISYRVIPSGSAANSQPEVAMVDISLDGVTVPTGGGEGFALSSHGYVALDQFFQNSGLKNPTVMAWGSPSPSATAVDLRWANGTVVQVPIETVDGNRFASFAWDPANPPEAVEQVMASGVQQIKITHDGTGVWSPGQKQLVARPETPNPITPSGVPNLSQTPKVKPISSGVLGEGTVSGHSWQVAYEVIPSGSAQNSSPEVLCTDTTVDGTTYQDGCTSGEPFGPRTFGFSASPQQQEPFAVSHGGTDPGTTSVGLEWADGSKVVTVTHDIVGEPMAALAFDPANPPEYLVEFGSYGEYRIPLIGHSFVFWTFNW